MREVQKQIYHIPSYKNQYEIDKKSKAKIDQTHPKSPTKSSLKWHERRRSDPTKDINKKQIKSE
jgi:hypothetical protein